MKAHRRWRKGFGRVLEPVEGNHVRLLQCGVEFFPALIAAIDAAQSEIFLETYIFNADASTERVRDALIRAAQRGVQVKLMIDGVGSRELPARWRQALEAGGVNVLAYRPLVMGWLANPRSLRRLHRKVAVIDARLAFVGGINLIDDFEPRCFDAPRLDFTVEVQGPLLATIHRNVRRLWRLVALSQLQQVARKPVMVHPAWPTHGHMRAAFVVRDNFAHRRDIEQSYLAAIALACEEIVIASAYFLPGQRFRKQLKKAAARGVEVRLLVQGHTDHPVFQAAARALYHDLLADGIRIYEYQPCELHAKVAVIDGHWSTVGSSNIDPFSLLLAREANVVIEDKAFGRDLRQRLHQAMSQSQEMDASAWQRRAWPRRLLSWLAYGGVRLVVGWLGNGRWA